MQPTQTRYHHRDAFPTIDFALLKAPNNNIDYPNLSTPTITHALRVAGLSVHQDDINILLQDHLLTANSLNRITKELIPLLLYAHKNSMEATLRISRILQQYKKIESAVGYEALEYAKTLMQQRKYDKLFEEGHNKLPPLLVFSVSSLNRIIIEYALNVSFGGTPNIVSEYLDDYIHKLIKTRPRAIGFSVLQLQRNSTIWLATKIKQMSNISIVIGGPDATTHGAKYLNAFKVIDVVFRYESERAIIDYLRDVECSQIPGICYRNKQGEICETKKLFSKNEASFFPDFNGLPLTKYLLPTLPISASRGCAFAKCKFCNHHSTYSTYYENKASNTVELIKKLKNAHGTRYFHFVDDMLDVNIGTKIASKILESDIEIRAMTYARFQSKFTKEILHIWHRAGIRLIEWGLESASPRLLKSMSKGVSIEAAKTILQNAADSSICSKVLMFHNYPGESADDLKESIELLRRLTLSRVVRPFFSLKTRFELRRDTPIEITSRSSHIFPKKFEPTNAFASNIEYANTEEYEEKERLLDAFLYEMQNLINGRKIAPINDDYVSLDLILMDLRESGGPLKCNAI